VVARTLCRGIPVSPRYFSFVWPGKGPEARRQAVATPFYEAEYSTEHFGLLENLRRNIHHKYYEAGHMMYLRDEDLSKLKGNVAAFVDSASKPQ
jgi:carboxypeptidase C (cathepsin A)